MAEMIIHPPRTIMEVFKMLPESTLAELINNQLFMSPAPIAKHQRISRKISTQLDIFVSGNELGEIFYAPIDVFLDEVSNAVQPDIIFISTEKLSIIDENGSIHGVPDLIVEVLSPGNQQHDRITKKALYQSFKVKEYWMVDPATRKAKGYKLVKGLYEGLPEATGKITSVLLKQAFKF